MLERERLGVEPRPTRITRHPPTRPIDGISNDRMIDRTHVDADLVCAPGLQSDGHERLVVILPLSKAAVVGSSRASPFGNGHPRRMRVVPPDGCVDRTGGIRESSRDQSEIAPVDLAPLECRLQMVERGRCLRHDEEPGGVAIDTVHDPPSMLRTESGDLRETGKKPVRKGPTRSPRTGVNDDSRGFVYDDHVVILIRDGELDSGICHHRDLTNHEVDLDHVTGHNPVRR